MPRWTPPVFTVIPHAEANRSAERNKNAFHAWQMRRDPDAPIGLADVRAGVVEAEHAMVDQVAGLIWNRLSPMDKRFLVAMLADAPDSSLADIAARLDRSQQYARTCRARLIAGWPHNVRFVHE